MTHYKDLTPYEYFAESEHADASVLNIGWLSVDQPYETEITSQEFRDRLSRFCLPENIALLARGLHVCEFCSSIYAEEDWNLSGRLRGNGEIRVQGQSVLYAAPALIYHYVMEHNYKPPQEFIDAVLTGSQPGSAEHQDLLMKYRTR